MNQIEISGAAVTTVAAVLNVKRRIIQNTGDTAAYFSNVTGTTEQIAARGIRLPGGVDATLILCERETSPGEQLYFTCAGGDETVIRIIDTL